MKIRSLRLTRFRTVHTLFIAALLLLCMGCGGEKPEIIKSKLDAIIASDFKALLAELPQKSHSDSVHFVCREYTTFKKGPYRVKAVVDFYYLRDVNVKRTVKYRYVKSAGQWERYDNEYVYY